MSFWFFLMNCGNTGFVKQVPEKGAIAEPHRIPLDVLRRDGDCDFFSATRDIHVSSNSRHFNRALFHTFTKIRKLFKIDSFAFF